MKIDKNKKYVFLLVFLLQNSLFGQINLIPNSSFENGGELSCSYNWKEDYNIDNWKFFVGSFDWFDWNWTKDNCTTWGERIPKPITSSKYVGIYGSKGYSYFNDGEDGDGEYLNESITVELNQPIYAGKGKSFNFKGRFYVTKIISNQIDISNNVIINLRFSTEEEWWYEKNIWNIVLNRVYKHNPDKSIITIPITITPEMANKWVEIDKTFILNHDSKRELENFFLLSHLVIQSDESNEIGSYVYIDDLELIELCNCLPAKYSQPLSFIVAPYENNTCITNIAPWFFRVENATEIIFRIFNQWGEQIYFAQTYDVNGLDNSTTGGDFQFLWNGIDKNGNSVMQGVYSYEIYIRNCSSDFYNYKGIIVTETNSPPNINIEDFQFYQKTNQMYNCCINHKYFQNIEFFGFFEDHAEDFISAGKNVTTTLPSGYVVINESANVIFKAGNLIDLQPGFTVEPQASFDAIIIPCNQISNRNLQVGGSNFNFESQFSDDMFELLEFEINNIHNCFNVHPNPFNNSFNIELNQEQKSVVNIYLTNNLGRKVLQVFSGELEEGEHLFEVKDISLPPGFYLCVYETPTLREVNKIIKIE